MADEKALLEQFAAQFDHGPVDDDAAVGSHADPADGGGAGDPADGDDSAVRPAAHFDVDEFLAGLDGIFDRHAGATEAGPYIEQAMVDAENAGDEAGLLTVLNEALGFYRSQGQHDKTPWVVQRAIELALRMGLEGSEAWATTLINCATAMRAAGRYDQAEDLYHQALDCATKVYGLKDRRLAALHNNLSMLYSETDRLDDARHELETALEIIVGSSTDPDRDIDVASTHTNLALVLLQEAQTEGVASAVNVSLLDEADSHASKALDIYRAGHLEHSSHYASALAGLAQVRAVQGRHGEAAKLYRQSLDVIEECYGKDSDYWRITTENLAHEEALAGETGANDMAEHSHAQPCPTTTSVSGRDESTIMPTTLERPPLPSGMQLARAFWTERVRPMLAERYPDHLPRIAAGLVGHGSECYGFDDNLSRDHDFGARCCLWLTDKDYAAIGDRLQRDYEALLAPPAADAQNATEAGSPVSSPRTPRAQGANRRDGVFSIGGFFESITGYPAAPAADRPHEWLMLDEATLAAATNGQIFADPLGAFSAARQGFKDMPDDVRLSLISRRLGMISQAGQYNLPRMLERGDGAAAWMSIHEFVQAAVSLVFLFNGPITVGYMPYYKWAFAALRRLSGRMATRLADVCGELETVMRLASAACFGGAGFGEGGKGAAPAAARINETVETIAGQIVTELRRDGLTRSDDTFLEWQRPYIEEHIQSTDPILKSL